MDNGILDDTQALMGIDPQEEERKRQLLLAQQQPSIMRATQGMISPTTPSFLGGQPKMQQPQPNATLGTPPPPKVQLGVPQQAPQQAPFDAQKEYERMVAQGAPTPQSAAPDTRNKFLRGLESFGVGLVGGYPAMADEWNRNQVKADKTNATALGNYNAQLGNLKGLLGEQSESDVKNAQATKDRAEALKDLNEPPAKLENLDQLYTSAAQDALARGVDPNTDPKTLQIADLISRKQKDAAPKSPSEEDKAVSDYLSGHGMEDTAANRDKARDVLKTRDKTPRAPTEFEEWKAAHPKEPIETYWNEKRGETAATRTMQEAAPKVLQLAQRVSTEIDKQADALGPASSRWSEFMAGKVGAPNPEFTKLRTDVGLLQTLLMRMHVGARGGESFMAHFKDLLDSGKQSPENLKAALEEITSYAQDVQKGNSGGGGATVNSKDPLGIR